MIAKIDPEIYDCEGRRTLVPKKRSLHFRPTHAMGSYLSGELENHCVSIDEVRLFLRGCRYVSDQEQFGHRDYWMRPRDFEKSRKGDCEDFALWTWRQLIDLGYDARFVLGYVSYARNYHAWVTYRDAEGDHYLVEPLASGSRRLSRWSVFMHRPQVSVGVEQGKLLYFAHRPRERKPTWAEAAAMSLWFAGRVPVILFRLTRSFLHRLGRVRR